jgi:hypothetical protein
VVLPARTSMRLGLLLLLLLLVKMVPVAVVAASC